LWGEAGSSAASEPVSPVDEVLRMSRRSFGSIRRRDSGRYAATYRHLGREHRAPTTFVSHADARVFLARIESEIHREVWIDPASGRTTVEQYGPKWIRERITLRPRTVELYERLLQHQIVPTLGSVMISDLSASEVRTWHAELARMHPSTAAKAYRLLSTMMRTALDDGLIARSPCRIKGGGTERAMERPIASVAEVEEIAARVPERFQALILLAAWAGLRRGEVLGLERRDLDLSATRVRVERAVHHMTNGEVFVGPPKTDAGVRTVHFPEHLVPILRGHLERFAGPEATSLAFPGEAGGILRPHVLYKHWRRATEAIERPELRFHDLRHSSATWAAVVGGTTRELMNRLGHASPSAALRYQHATVERDRAIAELIGQLRGIASHRDVAQMSPTASRSHPRRRDARRDHQGSTGQTDWSGRRESNPRSQLGKLMFCR
jgi:integrase